MTKQQFVVSEQLKDRRAQRQTYIHRLEHCAASSKPAIEAKLAAVEAQIAELRGSN